MKEIILNVFAYYRLQTRQWSSKTIKTIKRSNWVIHGGKIQREFQIVVTPRVVREARLHFDCNDLEGAELEDQGEEGTALTHWEKRVFEVFNTYLFNLNIQE